VPPRAQLDHLVAPERRVIGVVPDRAQQRAYRLELLLGGSADHDAIGGMLESVDNLAFRFGSAA